MVKQKARVSSTVGVGRGVDDCCPHALSRATEGWFGIGCDMHRVCWTHTLVVEGKIVKCWVVEVGSKVSVHKKGGVKRIREKSWKHRLEKNTVGVWEEVTRSPWSKYGGLGRMTLGIGHVGCMLGNQEGKSALV